MQSELDPRPALPSLTVTVTWTLDGRSRLPRSRTHPSNLRGLRAPLSLAAGAKSDGVLGLGTGCGPYDRSSASRGRQGSLGRCRTARGVRAGGLW